MTTKPAGSRYDAVAEWYDAFVGDADFGPMPEAWLDGVDRLDVLDLACGQGWLARELAARGAVVTAVDLSEALLDIARAREVGTPLGITYAVADATSPDLLDGRSFDRIFSNMALSDIDHLGAVVANMARLVRAEGEVAVSILHPCFPGIDGGQYPAWPPEGYLTERWWTTGMDGVRGRVGANHRTVSTYVNSFIRAGLRIEEVAESEWIEGLPGYLAIRCARHGAGRS